MKFLFVCRGNVGRSQIAEALFRKMTDGRYQVSSAGTKLSGPEQSLKELPLAEILIQCMKEEDIDVSNNICKQVTEKMAQDADEIILVVSETDPIPDYLKNNKKVTTWIVLDPKGQNLEFHREVKNQIKNHLEDLVGGLK